MRVCVLDLGGMSFHLLHARQLGEEELVALSSLRLPTRLGSKTVHTGVLDPVSWHAGLSDIGLLCQEIRSLVPDKVVAVATSAIRCASNSHAFIAEARALYDLDIEVLSEEEEAELSYRGAASALGEWSGSLAVVDLGGGSCELALGRGSTYDSSFSAPIGVLPLRDAFDIQDCIGPIKAGALAEAVRMALRPSSSMLTSIHPERLIFASGMARAVHQLGRSVFGDSLPPGQMTLMHMRSLRDFVIGWTPSHFLKYGVDPQRVDVIAIAIIVLEAMMSHMSCLTAEFSNRGLREGIALREFARGARHGAMHAMEVEFAQPRF